VVKPRLLLLVAIIILIASVGFINYVIYAKHQVVWICVFEGYRSDDPTIVDISNHSLKEIIVHYFNKSIEMAKDDGFWERMGIGERVFIFHDDVRAFFTQYAISRSWCGTCNFARAPWFKVGDTLYHVEIGYITLDLNRNEFFFNIVLTGSSVVFCILGSAVILRESTPKSNGENDPSQTTES
jgi:hypothetical protein